MESMETHQLSRLRRVLMTCGYAVLSLSFMLHIALWLREQQLHGFWGHFNEASRWFQLIDLTSLLAIVLCLFGVGWRRWLGAALGLMSFLLCCAIAEGL